MAAPTRSPREQAHVLVLCSAVYRKSLVTGSEQALHSEPDVRCGVQLPMECSFRVQAEHGSVLIGLVSWAFTLTVRVSVY